MIGRQNGLVASVSAGRMNLTCSGRRFVITLHCKDICFVAIAVSCSPPVAALRYTAHRTWTPAQRWHERHHANRAGARLLGRRDAGEGRRRHPRHGVEMGARHARALRRSRRLRAEHRRHADTAGRRCTWRAGRTASRTSARPSRKLQLAGGSIGICAAKISEAEVFSANGIEPILMTTSNVTPNKIRRAMALRAANPQFIQAVDYPQNARDLNDAAKAAGVVADVVVDVAIGTRSGVPAGEPRARARAARRHAAESEAARHHQLRRQRAAHQRVRESSRLDAAPLRTVDGHVRAVQPLAGSAPRSSAAAAPAPTTSCRGVAAGDRRPGRQLHLHGLSVPGDRRRVERRSASPTSPRRSP